MLFPHSRRAWLMHLGQTVFAQLMDFIPAHQFRRCVERYQGNYTVTSFSCWDQFLCMAFAQLTYRESLRDIETCLRALGPRLYHAGIRGPVSRSTLADANELRDWRIYADLAQVLIAIARPLYANESFGVELQQTVYALDCTTIDLCLSLFPGLATAPKTRPSSCTRCSICMATFLPFCAWHPRKSTRFASSTNCWSNPDPSTSWTAPTWTSNGCTGCTRRWLSSSSAPAKTSASAASVPMRWTKLPACVATRPFGCKVSIPSNLIPSRCVAFATTTWGARRTWCF